MPCPHLPVSRDIVCIKKCQSLPPVSFPQQSRFPESASSSVFMCCVHLGHCVPVARLPRTGKLTPSDSNSVISVWIASVEMLKTLSSLVLCVVFFLTFVLKMGGGIREWNRIFVP